MAVAAGFFGNNPYSLAVAKRTMRRKAGVGHILYLTPCDLFQIVSR
jgi:hypothetical protein